MFPPMDADKTRSHQPVVGGWSRCSRNKLVDSEAPVSPGFYAAVRLFLTGLESMANVEHRKSGCQANPFPQWRKSSAIDRLSHFAVLLRMRTRIHAPGGRRKPHAMSSSFTIACFEKKDLPIYFCFFSNRLRSAIPPLASRRFRHPRTSGFMD